MMFNREWGVPTQSILGTFWAGSISGAWQRMQDNATCVDGYTSAVFSWETSTTSVFLPLVKNKDSLTACDQTITSLHSRTANTDMHRVYHYWHSHPNSSHTHSWHSVEIFSSLVLPRKILTREPKFPDLGLFSTLEKKKKGRREFISSIT